MHVSYTISLALEASKGIMGCCVCLQYVYDGIMGIEYTDQTETGVIQQFFFRNAVQFSYLPNRIYDMMP